ncbi:MAG: hypothetical protein ACM30D_12375 [Hyphomicrobiales bacterium]
MAALCRQSVFASCGPSSLGAEARAAWPSVRLASRLGLGRRAKDVTPDLREYLDAAE